MLSKTSLMKTLATNYKHFPNEVKKRFKKTWMQVKMYTVLMKFACVYTFAYIKIKI